MNQIPDNWLKNTTDVWLDGNCHREFSHYPWKFEITLKRRFIKKSLFGNETIKTQVLIEEEWESHIKPEGNWAEIPEYKRLMVIRDQILAELKGNTSADLRKQAMDALVSSDPAEKDKFISDWLEQKDK